MANHFPARHKLYRLIEDFHRLKEIGTPAPSTVRVLVFPDDAVRAAENFFITCHSLKDWLKKDYPHLEQAIENYITSSPPLALAADYANMRKHGKLDRRARSGKRIDRMNTHGVVTEGDEGLVTSAKVVIVFDDGTTEDVLPLAEKCLRAWESFLFASSISILKTKRMPTIDNEEAKKYEVMELTQPCLNGEVFFRGVGHVNIDEDIDLYCGNPNCKRRLGLNIPLTWRMEELPVTRALRCPDCRTVNLLDDSIRVRNESW